MRLLFRGSAVMSYLDAFLICGAIVAAPGLVIWLWIRHLPTKDEK